MFSPWKKSYDKPRQCIKNRDITLPTKVHIVKVMIFPVFIYICESWAIKKAECQRIDVFELWCWRRVLRIPWIARRSNQSILKEINPEYSLEGLLLKMNSNTFCHLMQKANSLEKTDAGKDGRKKEKGAQRMGWLDSITNSMDMNMSTLQEIVEDRGACCTAVHGVTKSWTLLSD